MNAPLREARTSVDLTAADLARTLKAMQQSMTLPMLLSDALDLKQARGDGDIAAFKAVSREFGHGLNSTVDGCIWALEQWLKRKKIAATPAVLNFLDDLQRIQAGTFGRPE
jgi:hypothetical protein